LKRVASNTGKAPSYHRWLDEALHESRASRENSFRTSSVDDAARICYAGTRRTAKTPEHGRSGFAGAIAQPRVETSGSGNPQAERSFSEAKTQLYPRFDTYFLASELLTPLDFTIRSGTFGTFPATGPIPARDSKIHTPARPVAITSVTATQPLTQLIRINLSIKQQKLAAEHSQQSYFEREQELVNEVRRAYYAILQSQSELESQRALLAYLKSCGSSSVDVCNRRRC